MTMAPWRERPIVVIDTETTGLDPLVDGIVEIACLSNAPIFDGSKSWSTLVDPETFIPAEATAIHGITDAMIEGAPTFGAVSIALAACIPTDAVIVGYNVRFDRDFISHEIARSRGLVPVWMRHDAHWLDVLTWARLLDPFARGSGRFKLGTVADRLGVAKGTAHRAAGDVETTMGVLRAIDHAKRLPDDWAHLTFTQRIADANSEANFLTWLSKQPPRSAVTESTP